MVFVRTMLRLFLVLMSTTTLASEVDHFTDRFVPLKDSETALNERVNYYFKKSIDDANAKSDGVCHKWDLLNGMREYFANHIQGELIKDILHMDAFDRRTIAVKGTIYGDYKFNNGFLLAGRMARKGVGMGSIIRVGDFYVGSDKFEHMFGRGYSYFIGHYYRKHSLIQTLRQGLWDERFWFGGLWFQTGVFSYGDLVANFNGMRFWNHILGEFSDVLGEGKVPNAVCEGGRWKLNREIRLAEYLDNGFDEGINCSQFPTKKGTIRVINRVNKLKAQDPRLAPLCSAETPEFKALVEKYGELSPYLLNPRGMAEVDIYDHLPRKKAKFSEE